MLKRNISLFCILIFCVSVFLFSCGGNEQSDGESTEQVSSDGRVVICLDAGHGFGDPGCDSEYMDGTEAEVTIDMVMLLTDKLTAMGAEVVLTHDGERYPSADEITDLCVSNGIEYRADLVADDNVFSAYERGIYVLALSKELPIDFFVSVHVNSFPTDPTVDRYELFYYEGNRHAKMLKNFCLSFSEKLDNTAKISALSYEDAYIVTKYGDYPSVLVETGFASNQAAAEKLNSSLWRDEFCTSLAREIMEYVS